MRVGPELGYQGVTEATCVQEFHEVMSQPIIDDPQVPAPDRIGLRLELILEEVKETEHALNLCATSGSHAGQREALIELADGLADILYVVHGCAHEFGIPLDLVFSEVHRSNMSKVNEDGTVTYSPTGKVVKPDTYSPADIESILFPEA